MKLHNGSNRPARIILSAMLLLVTAGTVFVLVQCFTDSFTGERVGGLVTGTVFDTIGVALWFTMPWIRGRP